MKTACLFFFANVLVVSYSWKVEEQLTTDLLNKYDVRVRPSNDNNDPTDVNVTLNLLKFVNVDEIKGNVEMAMLIFFEWSDPRLTWHDNKVPSLVVPSTSIWVPDLAIYTGDGATVAMLSSMDKFGATVQSDGHVGYYQYVNRDVNCVHPDDKSGLTCSFVLESWAYDKKKLIIHVNGGEIDTSLMKEYYDKKYKIKSTSVQVKDISYAGDPSVWPILRARINFVKK